MKALILVDLQNDFMPGGSLAVTDGDQTVPVAIYLMSKYDFVVATQDHHPQDHGSFASNHYGKKVFDAVDLNGLQQVLWPDHCVEGTNGVKFHEKIDDSALKIFKKGLDKTVDSYSGFFDNGKRGSTGLHEWLQKIGITDLDIMGLATDYCVKFTVLDALELGYKVRLVEDGCRAVNINPGDGDVAIAEMKDAGAEIITSDKL